MRFLLALFLLLTVVSARNPENSLCDICLNVVQTVDDALKHGDDVKKAVHDFCANDVPSFLVNFCEKIVAQSLDAIIEALKEHKPAKEICETLHLC